MPGHPPVRRARGAATNERTGISAATRQGTAGNAATGREISGGQSVFYDRKTGEVIRTGHISGNQGSIVNIGGNVYAGHDGNVYRHTEDGWQEAVKGDQWQSPNSEASSNHSLDQDRHARNLGEQRFQSNRSATGTMRRSAGARRR